MWSEPFDLSIFTSLSVEKWCRSWSNLDSYELSHVSSSELRCPCTLQSAFLDSGRFSASPLCTNTVIETCGDKENIIHCVRSISASYAGHGLECCYDNNGMLTNINDTLDAGYAHRYHYLGQKPFDAKGTVPYLSHFTHDILPYRRCCNNLEDCREYFIPNRPSDDCSGYMPPTPVRMNGDPHIQTSDGLAYTFNGHGEYVLMDALNGMFLMHGRMEPLPSTNDMTFKATRFTAVAAEYNNGMKTHITLNQIHGLVAYVSEENRWSRIRFYEYQFWSNKGITILYTAGTSLTSVSMTVTFDFGLALVVEAMNEIMSVVVIGPEVLQENSRGLLGNWNDDFIDDLQPPIGEYIPANSTIHDIHYNFGEKWRIVPEESILYYPTGKTHENYSNPDFQPWFEQPNNIDQNEVNEVCGDIFECIFDYQVTGNPEIAQETKMFIEEFKEIVKNLEPVVTCGFVSTPVNGYKIGTVYTEGNILRFNCNDGYTLTGGLSSIVCTSDGVWSGNVPSCIKDDGFNFNIIVYVAIGVLGTIPFLIIIIICFYCKKRRTSNDDTIDLQNITRGKETFRKTSNHYTADLQNVTKGEETYRNPVYETVA